MRLHLGVLGEDQAGQQGGALLGRQRAQDVLKKELRQQQLVAADLAGHPALQLHGAAAVDVLEGLEDLRTARRTIRWIQGRLCIPQVLPTPALTGEQLPHPLTLPSCLLHVSNS